MPYHLDEEASPKSTAWRYTYWGGGTEALAEDWQEAEQIGQPAPVGY